MQDYLFIEFILKKACNHTRYPKISGYPDIGYRVRAGYEIRISGYPDKKKKKKKKKNLLIVLNGSEVEAIIERSITIKNGR